MDDSTRVAALVNELRKACDPATQKEVFDQLCAEYKQSPVWDAESPRRWHDLDEAIGTTCLTLVDAALCESYRSDRQARKQKTNHHKQTEAAAAKLDALITSELQRIQNLSSTPWRLRTHQLYRDLGYEALDVEVARALSEMSSLIDANGLRIPWLPSVKAISAAAEGRRNDPGKGKSRARHIMSSDVRGATEEMKRSGQFIVRDGSNTRKTRGKTPRDSPSKTREHEKDAENDHGQPSPPLSKHRRPDSDDEQFHNDDLGRDGSNIRKTRGKTPRNSPSKKRQHGKEAENDHGQPSPPLSKRQRLDSDDGRQVDEQFLNDDLGPAPDTYDSDENDDDDVFERGESPSKAILATPTNRPTARALPEHTESPFRWRAKHSREDSSLLADTPIPGPGLGGQHDHEATGAETPDGSSSWATTSVAEEDSYMSGRSIEVAREQVTVLDDRDSDPGIDFHDETLPDESLLPSAAGYDFSPTMNSPNSVNSAHGSVGGLSDSIDPITNGTTQDAVLSQLQPLQLTQSARLPGPSANGLVSDMPVTATVPTRALRSTVAQLLRVPTITGQTVPEANTSGMLQSLQPGMWLSASTIHACISAFNPDPTSHKVYEAGFVAIGGEAQNNNAGDKVQQRAEQRNIYLPVLISNSHWGLGIMDRVAGTVESFDSLYGERRDMKQLMQQFSRSVRLLGQDASSTWRSTTPPFIRQSNSHDCGIYVIVRAIAHMHNQPCPPSIIPELWRRVLTAHLTDAATEKEPSLTSRWILEQLCCNLKVGYQCTAPDFRLLPSTPPSLDAVGRFLQLSNCLRLLAMDTDQIVRLYRSVSDASHLNVNCLRYWKTQCPTEFTGKRHMQSIFDQEIQKWENVEQQQQEHRHRVSNILEVEVAMYQKLHEEALRIAEAMLEEIEQAAAATLQRSADFREVIAECMATKSVQ